MAENQQTQEQKGPSTGGGNAAPADATHGHKTKGPGADPRDTSREDQGSKIDLENKAAPTKPQNAQGHNVNRPQ